MRKSGHRKYAYVLLILLTAALFVVGAVLFSYRPKPDIGVPSSFDESRISTELLASIEKEYVPAGAEELIVIVDNITNEYKSGFGQNFLIERERKGAWFECPFAPGGAKFNLFASSFTPGNNTFYVALTRLEDPLKKGNYRLLVCPDSQYMGVLRDIPVLYFTVK